METQKKYYSNAKLLLTGEYLVLHGGLALALPLKFGQYLEITNYDQDLLEWQAFEKRKLWLHFTISKSDIEQQQRRGKNEKEFICFLLHQAKKLNPDFLDELNFNIKTNMDFEYKWGLGSSSTLINNVAQWAQVNPYELHSLVSKGSGYDIACANYKKTILFRQNEFHPLIYPIDYQPVFSKDLYFVYLNQKQNSEKEVTHFLNENFNLETKRISEIAKEITQETDPIVFDELISEHEEIIAHILDQIPVKEKYFSDFEGSIKSLGAWGGDFILARSSKGTRETKRYFYEKGYSTIFSWDELILQS